jgi:uncharacterized protein (TIGR00290 family)
MTRVAVSWSGGKDSCLALYKAFQKGLEVFCLLNFVSKDGRCMAHGVSSKLIVAQSEAIGIPLFQKEVTWETYEEKFKEVTRELKRMGVDGMVFGDIDIAEHLDWVIRVCNEVGVLYMEPLWRLDREQILNEFVSAGFEAVVVSARADIFGPEWLGRRIDESFIKDLLKLKATRTFDLCGEFGEYHTLVVDGPIFKRSIKIRAFEKVLKEDRQRRQRWLLDVIDFSLEEKARKGKRA